MTLPVSGGYSDWKPGDGDTIRNNEYTSLQSRQLRQLVLAAHYWGDRGPAGADQAHSAAGRSTDSKPPTGNKGRSAVGWHADKAYWSNCSSHNLLTAWIPFHDCDEAIGPLVVLDGSHKWPGTQDMRLFKEQNLAGYREAARAGRTQGRTSPHDLEERADQLSSLLDDPRQPANHSNRPA